MFLSALLLILLFQFSCQYQKIVPQKSPNDKRIYQSVTLNNKMKVLFIEDPQVQNSAFSITVGVGSIHEPSNSLGLAHFLQHMLFMGSKKYPTQNQYASFLSSNGGFGNAQTKPYSTTFFIQINNNVILQGAERMISFFIAPLIDQRSIEREISAVENQFRMLSDLDDFSRAQIYRLQGQQPLGRFSVGNKQTLSYPTVREELLKFYNQYYSSNIMTAAVYTNYSIEIMKQKLIPLLEQIPNKNITLPQFNVFFPKQRTNKVIRMQSKKDQNMITFGWNVEYLMPNFRAHVSQYFIFVMGNQGKNSLLQFLKLKKYASGTNASARDLFSQSFLLLEIKLTKLGYENYEQVYNIVMDYVQSIEIREFIYNEIKQKNLIRFKFLQKSAATNQVIAFSQDLQLVPVPYILNSSIQFESYQKAQVILNMVFNSLKEDNLIVLLSSISEIKQPKIQKYFGIKHQISKLPVRKKVNSFYQLLKNPFIPIDTTLLNFSQKLNMTPTKISDNVYLVQDSSFRVSKGGINLRIFTSQSYQFLSFYARYLRLLFKQIIQPAVTFSCAVTIDNGHSLIIDVYGFRDTAIKVIQKMAQSLFLVHNGKRSFNLFEVVKNQMIESLKNFQNQNSYKIANTLMNNMLIIGQSTVQQILKEYQSYTYSCVLKRAFKIWNRNYLRWVIVGNFDKNRVQSMVKNVKSKFQGIGNVQVPKYNTLKLIQNIVHEVLLEKQTIATSTAIVYYQAGPFKKQLIYKLLLLKSYANEPYFTKLRTIKKLAYGLQISVTKLRGVLGLQFELVSSTHDPKSISIEIKNFTQTFFGGMKETLKADNASRFQQLKESLLLTFLQPFKSLDLVFSLVVVQIFEKTFDFNRKNETQIRRIMDSITIQNLEQAWDSMKNRTAEVYVVSKSHQQKYKEYKVQSKSVRQIKSKAQFWEDFYREQ